MSAPRRIHWSQLVRPRWLEPVTREELYFAFKLAHAAAGHTFPVENPENVAVDIDWDHRGVETVSPVDQPITRAVLAITKEFPGQKGFSLGMRFWALLDAAKNRSVIGAGHVKVENGVTLFSDVLAAAIAAIPMHSMKNLRTVDLMRAVRREEKKEARQ